MPGSITLSGSLTVKADLLPASIASLIAAQQDPDQKIQPVARRMVGSLDPMHLHWIVDLDGINPHPPARP